MTLNAKGEIRNICRKDGKKGKEEFLFPSSRQKIFFVQYKF